MVAPCEFERTKKELRSIIAVMRANSRKIILGTAIVTISGSLFIGLIYWYLSGEFVMNKFFKGAFAGIIYFMYSWVFYVPSNSPKLSEIHLMSPKRHWFDRLAIKYWYILPILFDLGALYLLLSFLKSNKVDYFGAWVGILFFFIIIVIYNLIFYFGARNDKKLLATLNDGNHKK